MEEPEALDIVFEPVPIPLKERHKGWRWETLLNPVRAAPGSSARIRVNPKVNNARAEIRRIRARLEEVCPMEHWEFNVRRLKDDSGMYGIFATYHGVMTHSEKQDMLIQRKKHSEEVRRGRMKKKLNAPPDRAAIIRPGQWVR
jgi:hypothetical protein